MTESPDDFLTVLGRGTTGDSAPPDTRGRDEDDAIALVETVDEESLTFSRGED